MEARCLIAFDATAEQVGFPAVQQAAKLTRCIDSDKKPAENVELEWLVTSRPAIDLPPQGMLHADRRYWGIETGLHLRLDVVAGEDRSRVSTPASAFNIALIRRAVTSLAVHWIRRCKNKRQATMSGFYDFMAAKQQKKAFSLLTVSKSSWLP